MKSSVFALSAAACVSASCVFVHHKVEPGDPLDATFVLTWDLEEKGTGRQLDCIDIGADTVRVTASNRETGDRTIDLFDCEAYKGTTEAVDAGTYSVKIDLADCGPTTGCPDPIILSTTTPDEIGVWDDGDHDLGHVIFVVD
jgi:hypothetical protein